MDRCICCKKAIPEGAERIMTIDDGIEAIVHCCLKCDRKFNRKVRRRNVSVSKVPKCEDSKRMANR